MKAGMEVAMDGVAFTYGDTSMHFDARFSAGAITAVMGASGSGKSTLLNLVAGFEQPTAGRILFAGADLTQAGPADRPVSMVFQENNLFAHLTVAQNVGLGRSPKLKLDDKDRQSLAEALRQTGLADKEARLPHELSGGERQRVALARVLVRNRPVLLLDEPFASLGPALRDDMLDLLAELHAEQGMTVLFVTHQPQDARRVSSELAFLDAGRIVAAGSTESFFGADAPSAFKHYIGESESPEAMVARKRS